MRMSEAKKNIEKEISTIKGFTLGLGEMRESDYYNEVLGYKIGSLGLKQTANLIIKRMTAATTEAFNTAQ